MVLSLILRLKLLLNIVAFVFNREQDERKDL